MGSQTRKKVDRSLSSPCRTYSSRKMRLCELDCQRSLVYEDATFALLISLTLSILKKAKRRRGYFVNAKSGWMCISLIEKKKNKTKVVLMQRQLREN